MDKRLLDKLRQIQKYAEHGIGGERENAARMLNELLSKHGLKLEDLAAGSEIDSYQFHYSTQWEKKILLQLYVKTVNLKGNMIEYRGIKKNRTIILELTVEQQKQLNEEFKIYKKAFEEELDMLVSAFIQKHKLFSSSPSENNGEEIDWEALKRLMAMAENLKDVDIPVPKERQLIGGI